VSGELLRTGDTRFLMAALAFRREAQGLSVAEAAQRIGVFESTVARVEAGGPHDIPLDVLRDYVALLGGRLRIEVEFP
jgi:transcriptional regulator with XRE-family HTH domain